MAHLYSATGDKKGTVELPSGIFGAPVNWGLMHQAVVMQQSNRRQSPAHVKTRGEVVGSTKKMFSQKHTGNARRGPIRSPLMRGGGKAFGPRNDRNFTKDMPQKMRHAALRSCLTVQAQKDAISVLEGYPETVKTKTIAALMKKMSVEHGRRALIVMPEKMKALELSARNIPGVKTLLVNYLNPEDVLNSRHVIFVQTAIKKAEAIFGKKAPREVKPVMAKKSAAVNKRSKSAKKPQAKAKNPKAKKSTSNS